MKDIKLDLFYMLRQMGKLIEIGLIIRLIIVIPPMIIMVIKGVIEFYKDLFK